MQKMYMQYTYSSHVEIHLVLLCEGIKLVVFYTKIMLALLTIYIFVQNVTKTYFCMIKTGSELAQIGLTAMHIH